MACFGSLALYRDGQLVHISNKKAKELLALLLSEHGRPLHKAMVAETLWPEADPLHAMDNLYKACGAIRRLTEGIPLPLEIRRDTLWLDANTLDSDISRFRKLYRNREEMVCCQAAIELYAAPFLMNECYEWSAPAEAYYDMRYLTLLDFAENHFRVSGNRFAVSYYHKMRESFGLLGK